MTLEPQVAHQEHLSGPLGIFTVPYPALWQTYPRLALRKCVPFVPHSLTLLLCLSTPPLSLRQGFSNYGLHVMIYLS